MLSRILPAYEWVTRYRRADLAGDLAAGFIVAAMLVPQGMAYAMLAGLPPVMGLYASVVPLFVYALFGSSRHLAVGPVAMVSLVVAARCSAIATPGSPEYLQAVLLLCLMVGVLQVAMGLLRLGFAVNFLSHAVVSGFTSAAAVLIALSQLKHLLGIRLSSQHSTLGLLKELAARLGQTHAPTLALGVACIVVLALFRRKAPRFPAPILVVLVGTLLAYVLRLESLGVQTVGTVPRGFAAIAAPTVAPAAVRALAPAALTILFVGFMESISVAELIATKERYRVHPDQELRALGLANIAAAFFQGYPVTGGFSRTAVNYQAGAKTGLASILSAALVLLTLLFLTPLFYHLPNVVLGAIVVVAVAGLVDVKAARKLFRVKKADGACLVLTFVGTLSLGVVAGVLLGVAFSLLVFVWRSAHPHAAELGYVQNEGAFRDLGRYPHATTYPEVLILRVDASLYFANMSFLDDFLRERIHAKPATRWVVMDFSGVNDIDAVAVETLERLMETYREQGIEFAFAGMKAAVRDVVARAGWTEKLGEQVGRATLRQVLQHVQPGATL